MDLIHRAFVEAECGRFSSRPVIEMTIPSTLDPTVAPPGGHVVQLFTQYYPYTLDGADKQAYADTVYKCIEEYAPGFTESIIGADVLTPKDLEREFGLTGGNIFHGSMSLNQLYCQRPTPTYSDGRCPVKGVYLCGSGLHPGGGVMGSPGRIAANTVLQDRF